MSNANQYPININNIPMTSNQIPAFNQMDYFNNLNLQNNIQMYYLNKFNMAMENCDLMSFQATLTELEHQGHLNILNKIKNALLNKAILLYLIHYNQANSQNALKQIIILLLMKLKANPNICLRYINNGQNNINLNLNNLNNTYAIFPIVEKNDIELVKVFLDNNLDINIKDNQGRNCLFYLMTVPNQKDNLTDRKPLCSLLLNKGIKFDYIDNNGISPMMESINKGYYYIMNMFIKFGGNVNLINPNDGNTALHYAIMNKSQEALFTLLSKGNCDLTIKNNNGETAVDLAKKLDSVSNKEIYELIMQLSGNEKEKDDENNNSNKKEKKINSNGKDNDIFMFPPNEEEDISSRIEFPFSFQQDSILNNPNEKEINSQNKLNHQLHSLIKMESTPTLYIDISDEIHQNQIIFDGLMNDNESLGKTLEQKENTILKFKNENDMLKSELNMLKNELNQKNNQLNILNAQKIKEENELVYKRQVNQNQIEQKDVAIQSLLLNLKNLENEIKNENKDTNIDNINNENEKENINNNNQINNEKKESEQENLQRYKYLEKKFSDEKLTDNEIINLLTTDLYDFYHYNRMIYESRIQEVNKMINILRKIIDIDTEIKLYGSYETKTSLIWSEVDILIIPGKDILNNYRNENNFYNSNNYSQILYHKLKNTFLKVIYISDTQIISPIIKLEAGEQPNNIIYNIFVLENDNYLENLDDNSLLKSVKLSNEYIDKYKEKYIPILLGIKQLLYSAALIKNYYNINSEINIGNENYQKGISSYALNIMLMNFLDNYKTDSDDIPLGQIFVDFLKIYGFYMNENKRIIYLDYDNNGQRDKLEEMNYLIENNNMDKLIIIDPFNIKNNLTKKMYSFTQLETTFKIAFSVLKDNCECSCHYDNNINYQGKIHCVLNKIFKTVKRFPSIKNNS